ncbi:MAG: T9SS type A sorting domain-containing protein, partial [Bacteroidetes bacterium]|nr:T9SS type A sorting domain-containing protein [Bacteroidota bacterium]
SPVIVVSGSGADLFPHYNTDDQCDIGFDCELATVQAFLTCQPPIATVTAVDDCPSNSFTITVNVTSTGDAPTVTLEYDVNDGSPVSIPGIGAGEFVLGPFIIGDVVDVLVAHESDPSCNQAFDNVVSGGNCPFIIDCAGPGLTFDYCYQNSDQHEWTFQSSGGQAMLLSFLAGSIESANYDHLTIYNGPDNTYPVLYQHAIFQAEDLTGISLVGGPTIFMVMSSDGSVSCADQSMSSWEWTVQCLDCFPPTVAFAVQTDCASNQFFVNVDVTAMGNDPVLDIGNDGGAPVVNVPAPGLYQVGPFALNTPVVVTVVNDLNDLCSVASGPLVNTVCPFISCGPDQYTYCYGNDDHTYWVYQSNNGQPIGLEFLSGSLYPWDGDAIRVYDGLDQSGTLLYDGNNNGNDLGGMQWISTNPDNALTLEVSSTAFTSCSDGSATEWHYVVACYDGCSEPTASFSPVTDCAGSSFSVEVTVSDMGGAPSLTIDNDAGAAPVLASGPGTYISGPFTLDIPVVISVESTSALCNVYSDPLLNPLCPDTIICGQPAEEVSYCYINYDDRSWHWMSDGTEPLALVFSSGTIESANYDHLTIYDGPNNQAPVLYQHALFQQEDLTGLLVISTGTHLYMEMSSDGSVSCQSGSQTTWNWTVGCLDCTNPDVTFQVVPDCVHNSFNVAVNVASLGTATSLDLESSLDGATLGNVGLGTTLFGPFPLDSVTTIGAYNAANHLCRVFSSPLTYATHDCVIPSCSATAYEYCYTDSDTAWFMYQNPGTEPLTIGFLWGELMVNDYIQIYNGIGTIGTQIIYMGNNGGDMTGFAINSINGSNALTMLLISNSAGSCASGDAWMMHWVVECGAVGVNELAEGAFAMYPNPTTGELYIRLPQGTTGPIDLRVLDVAGREVRHEAFTARAGNTDRFDLQGLQNGNYTVLLSTTGWVKAQQLQIVR